MLIDKGNAVAFSTIFSQNSTRDSEQTFATRKLALGCKFNFWKITLTFKNVKGKCLDKESTLIYASSHRLDEMRVFCEKLAKNSGVRTLLVQSLEVNEGLPFKELRSKRLEDRLLEYFSENNWKCIRCCIDVEEINTFNKEYAPANISELTRFESLRKELKTESETKRSAS